MGENINDVPPYKRNVNTVFQRYALFPHLNVFENVAFPLREQEAAAQTRSSQTRAARCSSWSTLHGLRAPQRHRASPADSSSASPSRVRS